MNQSPVVEHEIVLNGKISEKNLEIWVKSILLAQAVQLPACVKIKTLNHEKIMTILQ
jgi:hypothetical protein